MNIPINKNIQHSIDQQAAEQTILLNAIRHKFANNENNSGTSPPVFSIPSLKFQEISHTSSSLPNSNKPPPSKLNQFILGKLGESNAHKISHADSFKIPDLKIQNNIDSRPLTLAERLNLEQQNPNANKINSLNKGINSLSLCEEQKTHVIDLTTALNKNTTLTASPAKQMTTTTSNPIDFQIPFIDCDLKDATLQLPLRDEHCLTNVSGYVHRRFISAPSRFGKITCLKYRHPKLSTLIDHSFVEKHKITRFGFDTKSPDDIILGSLRRCNRV